MTSRHDRSAFVLGLDGVPWEFMERWATSGELPNFRRVIEEGAAGPLESTTPYSTPLAWPSIVTGSWPDQHGVYSFQRLTASYTNEMYTHDRVRGPKLWDVMSPAVVGNVPMTYPVDEIDGKMVAGMMAPELNRQYTHPPELGDEIERTIPEYEIGLTWAEYVDDEAALVEDIGSLLDARRQLMELLMETTEWELFFFTYTEPDRLQHLVWDEEVLLDHYRELDEILGDVLEYVDSHDASLFVVSDHGFGPVSKTVAANSVLESEGYLERKRDDGSRKALSSLGIHKDNIRRLFETVGVNENEVISKYVPDAIANRLASTVPGDHFLFDVDHDETEAFVHELGNVYVNDVERFDDGIVEPERVETLKAELKSIFGSVTDPATGARVLTVHDGDELYPRDDRSPDLVLEPAEGYEVSRSLTDEHFVTPDAQAAHEKDGIFLAWGDDIETGGSTREATVVDVAPTVLHASGQPIPEGMDGRVLREIFAPESWPREKPASTIRLERDGDSSGENENMDEVKERLQGLGYME